MLAWTFYNKYKRNIIILHKSKLNSLSKTVLVAASIWNTGCKTVFPGSERHQRGYVDKDFPLEEYVVDLFSYSV